MFADATWLVGHVLWADAAARSRASTRGDGPVSTPVAVARPVRDARTPSVHGGVAHYLGLLAHTLDRHDEAERWFRQALALHEAMEAPFFVALTQAAWADLLVAARPARGREIGRDRSSRLPSRSPIERGFGSVERDARSVLARVSA